MGAVGAAPAAASNDRRRLWLLLTVALCAPGLVALYLEFTNGGDRAPAVGDAALLELGTRHALSLEQWLGPYSRHRWHHPGPLYFYLLSPAYLLGGRTAASLHAGVAVLNLVLVLGILRATRSLLHTPVVQLCGCALLSLWLHHFNGLLTPTGWSVVWSPVAMLLPYALLLAASTRLALGGTVYAIPSLMLHAWVAQTHVAFVPLASVALLVGVAGYLRSRARSTGQPLPSRRHLGVGAALLLVLWLPVLVDQLARTHNLARVIAFFLDTTRGAPEAEPTYPLLAQAAIAPVLTALALDTTSPPPIAAPLLLAQAILLPWLTVRAWRRADRAGLAMLATALTQSGVAAVALREVDDPQLVYLTHWLGLLFCWNWVAIARGLAGPVARHGQPSAAAVRIVGAACVLVTVVSSAQQVRAMSAHRPWLEKGMLEARTAVTLLSPILAASRTSTDAPPLRIGDNDAWPVAAGLVLEAHRGGEAQIIDPDWSFMFGDDLPTSDETDGALTLTLGVGDYGTLLAHSGPFHLYRRIPDDHSHTAHNFHRTPQGQPVRLAPWDASGGVDARQPPASDAERGPSNGPSIDTRAMAAAAMLVDGEAPAAGSPWNHAGAVLLRDSDAWITLRVPPLPIAKLRILADNNDTYRVQGALGKGEFETLAITSTADAPGLQWREVNIPRDRVYSVVRLGGSEGDGQYSIAEVEALTAEAFVVHLGRDRIDSALGPGWGPAEGSPPWRGRWVTTTDASVTIPASPGVARTLVFSARPFTVDGRSQSLRVGFGPQQLTHVTMDPQLRSYAVDIPPLECAQACTLWLRFDYAQPPSQPALAAGLLGRAAWFEALFVVASEVDAP